MFKIKFFIDDVDDVDNVEDVDDVEDVINDVYDVVDIQDATVGDMKPRSQVYVINAFDDAVVLEDV